VSVEVAERVADVRLARPDKRNALDGRMFLALAEVGKRLTTEAGVRAVVLSGEGASFCAGLDFSVFDSMSAGSGLDAPDGNPGAMYEGGLTHLGQQVAWVWQQVPVPVIAAVHGHAMGGGMQLALGADIRIVHPETQLSVREVHWGLIPDMTGTITLAGLVGDDVAKDLVFTARIIDGREAARLGLATRVSDTPRDDALAMAAEIAQRSPHAVRAAKRLLNRAAFERAAEQLAAEREEMHQLVGSPNQLEAIAANIDRRAPVFVDPE
jgi:enoyl-CoA hydratase/carnithine racemase